MGVSHVSAADRDVRRKADSTRRLAERHLMLATTTIVCVLAIGLSYCGKLRAHALAESSEARLTNLNSVMRSEELERPFELIFADASDRRFAARRLFEFILSIRDAGRSLPNVGAILGATAPAETIERTSLVEYQGAFASGGR